MQDVLNPYSLVFVPPKPYHIIQTMLEDSGTNSCVEMGRQKMPATGDNDGVLHAVLLLQRRASFRRCEFIACANRRQRGEIESFAVSPAFILISIQTVFRNQPIKGAAGNP